MEIMQAAAGAPFAHFLAALAVPPEALGAYLKQQAKQSADVAVA
ncbi:MAG TPA: hypothetical protein VGD78_11285 [Chthoniobacterales bacterium]